MNYFKNLEKEQNRLNLKSEKVELSMLDDAMKLRDKAVDKSNSAMKNVMGALSDLADTTRSLEDAIKLTNSAIEKAKELGADDYVKRGSKLQSAFENVLKKHRQAITDLRNVKSNI